MEITKNQERDALCCPTPGSSLAFSIFPAFSRLFPDKVKATASRILLPALFAFFFFFFFVCVRQMLHPLHFQGFVSLFGFVESPFN
jgi:hypothetical protein